MLVLLALLLHGLWTLALPAPSALLVGANLEEARAFAVANAASRGWRILRSSTDSAVFEQLLQGNEEDGFLVAERTLRVFANFAEESAGVRVSLRAEEVEWPGTEDEWMTDVTGRHGDNLVNALTSLRDKWDARRPEPIPETVPLAPPSPGRIAPDSAQSPLAPIGAWAYAAERLAIRHGCELADQATRLESSGQDWEQHRVFCRDGSQILVQCRHGDCIARD